MDNCSLLSVQGDPIEQEGCEKYQLHKRFPNYAEFWAKYVFPNRDDADPSKLRDGFPVLLEQLFNSHYLVWFHLAMAYRHIEALSGGISDPGDSLYHLGSSIDLAERTFVIAFREKNRLDGSSPPYQLTRGEYDRTVTAFWEKKYQKRVKVFEQRLTPVTLNLHNVTDLFNDFVPKTNAQHEFNKVLGKIRPYRNVFTHNLMPLRLSNHDDVVYLPTEDHLKEYSEGLWSSKRNKLDSAHYVPAAQMIRNLADELVLKANVLWVTLLDVVQEITASAEYRDEVKSVPLSSIERTKTAIPVDNSLSTGCYVATGTAGYRPDCNPPLRPSGVHILDEGDLE